MGYFVIGIIKEKLQGLLQGGFFHIFVGNTLVKMIGFISSIVIVRLVDKNDYAYLSYADNLYTYVISFAGLGMTSSILKYCATAKSKEEDKAYFHFAMKYGTAFEALLSIVVIVYVSFASIPFPDAKGIVYALSLYPVVTNLLNTIMSYLRAHGENEKYSQSALIQTSTAFVGSALLVLKFGVIGIAFARYIAVICAILWVTRVIKKYTDNSVKKKLEKKEIKAFMSMSVALMVSNLFSMTMPINEQSLVNEILHNEIVTANYRVATLIPSQMSFITQSIIIYYFTILAQKENNREVWKLSKQVGILSAVIISLVTIVGIILTPWIITFVYGDRYSDAITLSVVFWIVNALNAAIRMVPMNFLPAIGIAKFNAWMAIGSCIIHFIIAFFAISVWGIWGAGIATGIIYVSTGLIYWLYFRKQCLK